MSWCINREVQLLSQIGKARRQDSTLRDAELQELEQELECPVCMEISRPPIYQCEEGHIICAACKPILTQCPSCSSAYSNPVIRDAIL